MVMGEDEWWEDRLITSFDYRREYPNAPLSFLADAGHGHFDISDELIDYLSLFRKRQWNIGCRSIRHWMLRFS